MNQQPGTGRSATEHDNHPGFRPSHLMKAGDGLSSVALFALMVMTCVDVAGRYFFNAPLDGATELTQLMMGVIVFAILPTVCYREEHVSVDLLDLWMPSRWINRRQCILNGLMAIMLGSVAWRVWISAGFMVEYGDATEFLGIPYAPITYFIAIMNGAAAIAFLFNAARYVHGKGPMSPERQMTSI
ncbi:MAG: TRAP transporter small permease [Arenicellales bacterium]|nr:TRAP transporter small permease [Arenicellales bacterium]MDP6551132.1 TRAP transporter small permease [Arenicellales bacterium]MDP6918932.1 TRAP transporter small permease [Arenicellales bacterium]